MSFPCRFCRCNGTAFGDPCCAQRGPGACRRATRGPGVSPARYAQPVQVYQRRSAPTPAPPPAPEAPATPTLEPPPPPPPAPSRAEPAVYHPPVVHQDPRHIYPMVTRRMASQAATLRHRGRAAGLSGTLLCPQRLGGFSLALRDGRGVRGSSRQPDVGPRAASVWLQCGDWQVDLDEIGRAHV